MYIPIDRSDYHVLHPRPVYLIVSRSSSGSLNVMSASWVTPVESEPFLVAVSIWKGSLTYRYIGETGEFTINIPSERHVDVVYRAGTISGREVDKLKTLNLQLVESSSIKTPGLANMLGFLECRLLREIEIGDSALIIAEVEAIHVAREIYTKHGWDLGKTKILLHHGGRGFTTTHRLILATR